MNNKAIERIQEMEAILDAAKQKMDALEAAAAALVEYQPELKRLEAYYTSSAWKKDFSLDEAGKLPVELKRGVLSEDGIYNILERNSALLDQFCRRERNEGGSDRA